MITAGFLPSLNFRFESWNMPCLQLPKNNLSTKIKILRFEITQKKLALSSVKERKCHCKC